ncbi:MAG: hypothetical protein LBI33_11700, partial [Propionibacteriaceae bacterium]|jgi:predicted branched-subunit amino acid permease|nr:hypothetical protein [Propionibacteriaceae bacterium]
VFVGWNLCTFVGALAGNALGDPKTWGLDAAAAAAFLALLWPRLASRTAQACAGLAVAIAVALVPVAPPGIPVLCAGLAAVIVGTWDTRRGAREPRESPTNGPPGGTPRVPGGTDE